MHEHRHVQRRHQLPETAGRVLVRIVALVAGVDQHAVQLVVADGALQLPQEVRAAAGDGAGEAHQPPLVAMLDLGRVLVPALDGPEGLGIGHGLYVMDGVADDHHVHAGAVVDVEQVVQVERRAAVPGRPLDVLRRIDVGVPVEDHGCIAYPLTPLDKPGLLVRDL